MAISLVLVTLLFLLIAVPMIDMFVRNETQWSMKAKRTTTAFHLAEAGLDRAKWKFAESTDIWVITGTGTVSGYNFDKLYSDVNGGVYAIKISSDPYDEDKRIVEAVGKDVSSSEIRRIRAVFENTANAEFATRAEGVATNTGGNPHVEWGPVVAATSIDATGRTFPRFFSAGHVVGLDGGSTAAGTDGLTWWSYYPIPPRPIVKFSYYSAAAAAADLAGGAPASCGGTYVIGAAGRTFEGCTDLSNNTYYAATGDITFKSGGSGNHIRGNIIALTGNVLFSGNGGTGNPAGTYNARIPPSAWKEYCKDAATWAYYLAFDSSTVTPAPATCADATASNYEASTSVSTRTYRVQDVLVHGFLYAGGNQGLNGGGNGRFHGVFLTGKDATMGTSNFLIYYDDTVAAAVQLTGINATQTSWYEVAGDWPSGL